MYNQAYNLANMFGAGREIRKPSNDGQDEEGRRQADGDKDDDEGEVPAGILLTEVADLGVEVLKGLADCDAGRVACHLKDTQMAKAMKTSSKSQVSRCF